ncbi:hypothetical protein [Alteromonas lipolytica]|uniref:hypothetical protein n=1 Tax=Alteromonas lipolytica TaxID=1856405 RepID=UPI001586A8D0|nr:hypothetical protein [Alteromonas lipolytica]GGF81244.1 hypothetical protein GCM10011338_36840 [Alteromonas lipolytica]
MSTFKRVSLLAVLLLGALGFYQVGFQSGALLFLALGVVLEISFWFGVFKWQKAKSED